MYLFSYYYLPKKEIKLHSYSTDSIYEALLREGIYNTHHFIWQFNKYLLSMLGTLYVHIQWPFIAVLFSLYKNIIYFIHIRQVTGAAAAKSLQSCPTRCNPVNGSPSGFSVPGILQARTLEWVSDRHEIVKMVRTHNYLLSLTSFLTM